MIVLAGNNPMGNVIHVITGPETELLMDIQGASIMDLTEMLSKFESGKSIFLSLSRSRSELTTAQMMQTAGMATNAVPVMGGNGCSSCSTQDSKKDVVLTTKDGVCDYCGSNTKLLPIPNSKICISCAQIELGKSKSKKSIKIDSSGKPI